MVSSFKNLEDLIDEKVKYGQYLESTRQTHRATEKGLTIEAITNILNMKSGSTKQLEGNLLIGLTGFKRFFTFDNSTIERLPEMLKGLAKTLENGINVNYQKLYNEYSLTIGLPTATGWPLVYTLNTPTLLSAKGKFKVEVASLTERGDNVFVLPDFFNATTEMVFHYSTRTQSKISFVTPFNYKRYIAGYDKNTQLELPINKKFDMDFRNAHVKVQLKPLFEGKDNRMFHYSTWPYLAIDNVVDFKPVAESTEIIRVRSHQLQKYQHSFGDKEVGMIFRVEGESDRQYFNLNRFYQKFLKHGFVSALLASTSTENVEQTILDFYYDGQKSTARSVTFTGSFETLSMKETDTERDTQGESRGTGTENRATTTEKTVDSQTRRHEFLGKVRQGIKGSSAAVIDLGVEIEGQTQSGYLITVALATSPVDGNTRILGYMSKNVNNRHLEACLDTVSRMPKIPLVNFAKILETDLKGDIHGKLSFGEECTTGSKITITGNLKRSQERREYLEKHPVVEQAKQESQSGYRMQPSQMQASKEAGILDDYVFTVNYENVPEELKKMAYQAYSTVRFLGYPYMSENVVGESNLQEGQVELGVNFTPDLKTVNFHIYSPLGDSRFSNIQLNQYLTKSLTVHPMYSTIERVADVAFNKKYGG